MEFVEEKIAIMKPMLLAIFGFVLGYIKVELFTEEMELVEMMSLVKNILASVSFIVSILLGLKALIGRSKKKV